MHTRDSVFSDPVVVVGGGHGRRRLLYIEDNQSNLTLVQWILDRTDDVDLLTATRGGDGLELAREHLPELIMLDLHLPDMSGETVLQCLQADVATRRIPVVVLSADAGEKRIKRLLRLGARDYLTKPLDIPSFLRVIDAEAMPRS